MAEYQYSGKTWTPCSTYADGNCFFHALFGERAELNGDVFYFDRQATFRRMYWATFLMFFRNEEMPPLLSETIHKCFVANDTFANRSPQDPDDFNKYISNVALGEYWVLVAEIALLSTLWNVRVVLFLGRQSTPEVFEPNPLLSGKFPFSNITPVREEVIRLENNHFERMSSVLEPGILAVTTDEPETSNLTDFDTDEEPEDSKYTQEKDYKKGGSAGIQGGFYQINVLAMVLLNALKKSKVWRLSTENEDGGKFDDLILESPSGDILLQAKHKEGKKKVIGYEALLSTSSSDFSLAKYYISFLEIRQKFELCKVVICTNASLQTDKKMVNLLTQHTVNETDVLYFEGAGNVYFTFNEDIIPDLKQAVTKFQKQNVASIHEKDIKDFLAHLQVFVNFMNDGDIKKFVDVLISTSSLSQDLDSTKTYRYVRDTISQWFTDERGRYINHHYAKALIYDVRSSTYWEKLEVYNISFRDSEFPFQSCKKVLHVIPSIEPELNIVKILQILKKNKLKSVFFNPNESLYILKQLLEVFEFHQHAILVIDRPGFTNEELVHKLCKKLLKIVNNSEYKRVLLVTDASNKLAQQMKSSNLDSYEMVIEDIRYQDLTQQTQEEMKNKRNIIFQGFILTLEELLGQDLNSFVDAQVLAQLARDIKIVIGSALQHVDENLDSYYIDRTLKRHDENIKEEQFHNLEFIEERMVLKSDSAGMGKTTILTNLAIWLKRNHPSLWVLRIDLNNHAGTFKHALKKRKSVSIADVLNGRETTNENEFTRRLFFKQGNVVLMLDAVDEVSPSHMELVMKMIDETKAQKNFAKVFVTTRPHLCEELQERLGVNAFTLQPFSKDNQVDFLTNYWSQKLELVDERDRGRCRRYADALIEEMSRWINENSENTFAGIPLQTRMLAEVFQERNHLDKEEAKEWVECKEFVLSNKEEPELPKRIDLIQLYELFIEKKRDIFVEEKGNTEGNAISENALKATFEECHQYHRNMALPIIFYSDECRLFGCFKRWEEFPAIFIEDYVLRAGIVQRQDGKINFIHRTFAEYFAAQCLMLELKGSTTPDFREFLLDEVLIREEYHVVRAFFDSFLKKELTHVSDDTLYAFRDTDYTSIISNSRNSYLHLFAQEDCVGIMEFFIACVNFGVTGESEFEEEQVTLVNERDLECNTPLHEACFWGHLNVAVALINRGANVNLENANGETPLHVAAFRGHLELVEYLVNEAEADINKVSSYWETPLLSAALGGHYKIVRFLCQRGTTYAGEYTTALHMACADGNLDIVQYLVEDVEVDMNRLDIDKCTPLHAASHEGELEIVQYLVGKGCDVNNINKEGNTAFHGAALRGMFAVVKFLVENGADVELEDEDGYTIGDLLLYLKKGNDEESNEDSDEDDDEEDADESDEESGEDEEEDSSSGKNGSGSESDDSKSESVIEENCTSKTESIEHKDEAGDNEINKSSVT